MTPPAHVTLVPARLALLVMKLSDVARHVMMGKLVEGFLLGLGQARSSLAEIE